MSVKSLCGLRFWSLSLYVASSIPPRPGWSHITLHRDLCLLRLRIPLCNRNFRSLQPTHVLLTFVGSIIDLVRFGIPAGYGIYIFIYFINLLVLLCALRGQRLGFYHYCWLTIVVPKLAQHKDFRRAEEGARLGDPPRWAEGTGERLGIPQVGAEGRSLKGSWDKTGQSSLDPGC